MKNSLISLLIITSLLSIVFGLVTMDHMNGHGKCPFETVATTNCVAVQSPTGSAISHLNAFSRFFSVIPINNLANLLALSVLLAFAILTFSQESELFKLRPLAIRGKIHKSFISPNKILLASWLALHENSPALS